MPDNIQCSVISAIEDIKIPPGSVLRIPVSVRSARGKKIVKGTYGICATAFDKLGVWHSLNKVDYDGNIFAVVTNSLDDEQIYRKNETLGFFQPIYGKEVEVRGISEARIDEFFLISQENQSILILMRLMSLFLRMKRKLCWRAL